MKSKFAWVLAVGIFGSSFAGFAAKDPLTEFTDSQSNQAFTGSPITLQLKDADVREVLRMIGEASGFNVIVHQQVQGKISLSLEQVPWDQALQVVLNTMGLGADRQQSVLRVMPKDILVGEKQRELEAKRVASDTAPRITRIFPISYADLSQLLNVLNQFSTAQARTPGASTAPGTIITDLNTNSIIVRDTQDNVDRIKKMIELLDVQTPQVLIEAKVVEASEVFAREITGASGIADNNSNGSAPRWAVGFRGGDPTQAGFLSTLSSNNSMSASAGTLYSFPGSAQGLKLIANLNLQESLNRVKIVSSPKLVVISGKAATISQSQTANVSVTVTTPTATTTTVQPISAETRLNVTPRVTNDGSVFLKIDLNRGVLRTPQGVQPYVEPRNMNTEVIVESGGTIVIGGVLSMDDAEGENGVPFLRDIPLIGWLFGGKSNNKSKTELMFFVTPRVLNPKKTGIMSAEG